MKYLSDSIVYPSQYEGWLHIGDDFIRLSMIERVGLGNIEVKDGTHGSVIISTINEYYQYGFVIPAHAYLYQQQLMEILAEKPKQSTSYRTPINTNEN